MTLQSNTTWMIWPDSTMAQLDEIERGDYAFMSDDYRLATDAEVAAYMDELDDFIEEAVAVANSKLSAEEKVVLGPRVPFYKLNS